MVDESNSSLQEPPDVTQRITITQHEYFAYIVLIALNGLFTLCSAFLATEGCRGTNIGQNLTMRICQQPWLSIGPCISSLIIVILFVFS